MLVPELTFQFQQLKDFAGGAIDLVHRDFDTSTAATVVTTTVYTVPSDRILVLSVASAVLEPGAGQIAQYWGWQMTGDGGISFLDFARGPEVQNATADRFLAANFFGELWVPPGQAIRLASVFNSGVGANRQRGSLFGVSIPRANVQQG